MRIALICSGAEPGADGVGDYCMGLAEEARGLGHEMAILALGDKFLKDSQWKQETRYGSIKVMRLGRELSWEERIEKGRTFLDQFDPDWVSFQFVSYGFDPKGIVNGLARRMSVLTEGRRVHIMMHELWLGANRGASIKYRAYGAVQCFFIRSFIRGIKAEKLHTSNPAYQTILGRKGIHAELLPLFGNIPIQTKPTGWMSGVLAGLGISEANRSTVSLLGIFGAVPAEWSVEGFLTALLEAKATGEKMPVLLAMGACPADAEARLKEAAIRFSGRVRIASLGRQPAEHVSEFLGSLDFGVATAPWCLIGKSGATAAMREFGLPILVYRDDVDIGISEKEQRGLIRMRGEWAKEMQAAVRTPPMRSRPQIAKQWIDSLQ